MSDLRHRLDLARRRAALHREDLAISWSDARDAMRPGALKQRARYRTASALSAAADTTEHALKAYRWPLIGLAVGGLLYALRRPIARAARPLAADIRRAAASGEAALRDLWDQHISPQSDTAREGIDPAAPPHPIPPTESDQP